MRLKLFRDKNGKIVATKELGPNDDGVDKCKDIQGENITEVIEAPADYSQNFEKFLKEHQK